MTKTWLCFCAWTLFFASVHAAENGEAQNESLIRAAVVFGILRFVDWPEQHAPKDIINLCEYGESEVAEAIRSLNGSRKVGKRKVVVKTLNKTNTTELCHALLIGEESPAIPLQKTPALAFCDNCEQEYRDMTSVVLKRNENLVQFEVNLDHLDQQDIRLSASVIELASKCYSSNPSIKGCSND
ncbi:YfiR family protein [Alteromonas sediminis]|uniref:YfiR family protein n=1 Tax=Alteromonas sediminis TaxID=2259342 RepID=UPI001404D546|nr:YfiR family protein [Alteromonas sediminis]